METDKLTYQELIEKHVEIATTDFRNKFDKENLWKDDSEETAYVAIGNIEEFIANHIRSSGKSLVGGFIEDLNHIKEVLTRQVNL